MPQVSSPDLYDDGPSGAPHADGDNDGGAGGKTAMLNKEVLCGEASVGSEFTIRIVADHGNEVEVECTGGGNSEKSKTSQEPAPEGGDGSMQSMLDD